MIATVVVIAERLEECRVIMWPPWLVASFEPAVFSTAVHTMVTDLAM